MTAAAENSTRTNAAGEKYSLRGIYGSEPYWPEAKLKICVTGAGGFIGACHFLSFFWVLGDAFDLSLNLLVSFSLRKVWRRRRRRRAFFWRSRSWRDWKRNAAEKL